MPRKYKYATPELSASPRNRHEFIYALRCPITKTERYVGRTSTSLSTRYSNHMGQLTAKKAGNPDLLAWKRELDGAGLRPEIVLLEEVYALDANSAERRWTRHFQKAGNPLLNVRNILFTPVFMGYDLWELNDIADLHKLEPGDVGIAINMCQSSVISFLSGAKRVGTDTAANVVKFLHSLPKEPIVTPHHGIRNYVHYFLDETIKAIWNR